MRWVATIGLFAALNCSAQYDTIEVGMMTTVHLIFNARVMNYDLGSGARLEVQNGVEHEVSDVIVSRVGDRLKLAAAIERFETTNLFVETAGAYFNFILAYRQYPKKLSHYISLENADHIKLTTVDPDSTQKAAAVSLSAKDLDALSEIVLAKPHQNPEVGEESQKVMYYLNGIFISENVILFRVTIINKGSIQYDLGYEGFFIKDRKNRGLKKSALQSAVSLEPLFVGNKSSMTIHRREEISKVYAFKKFTLEPSKVFSIEFWEDEGQRRVELKISPSNILSAKTL